MCTKTSSKFQLIIAVQPLIISSLQINSLEIAIFIEEVVGDIFLLVSNASLLVVSPVFQNPQIKKLKYELTIIIRDDWQPCIPLQVFATFGKSLSLS